MYLKNTQRPWKALEFYHSQEDSTLFYFWGPKSVVNHNAAPNKGTIILILFSKTNIFSNGLLAFQK